jgi:hypothetical protein
MLLRWGLFSGWHRNPHPVQPIRSPANRFRTTNLCFRTPAKRFRSTNLASEGSPNASEASPSASEQQTFVPKHKPSFRSTNLLKATTQKSPAGNASGAFS